MGNKKRNFNYALYEEHVTEVIRQLLTDAPKAYRVDIAHNIAFEAANWSGRSQAESVGILELAKRTYIEVSEEVFLQEEREMMCESCIDKVCQLSDSQIGDQGK